MHLSTAGHDCRGDCGSVAVIDYWLLEKTARTVEAYSVSPNMASLCKLRKTKLDSMFFLIFYLFV